MDNQNSNQNRLQQLEWLLEKSAQSNSESDNSYEPNYGDVAELNTCRTILDSVGKDILKKIAEGAIDLLDTSVAVFETNGDYAFGMFSSQWCQLMDTASRNLCHTDDNRKALDCGRWLCHENCWNNSAKAAIESGRSTDIECVGGLHLYAEPIYAGETVVGVINIGYGTPPVEEKRLKELGAAFGVDVEKLREQARAYHQRPEYIINLAKKRLQTSANLIGAIVEKSTLQKTLQKNKEILNDTNHIAKVGGWSIDAKTFEVAWTDETYRIHEVPPDYKPSLKEAVNFFHPADRRRLDQSIQYALDHGEPYDMELRLNTAKGGHRWTRNICRPEIVKGKTVRLQGVIQDITERKSYEDALLKSEYRFRQLFEHMSSGVAIYETTDNGNNFVFKDFNKAAEKIDRISKDKVIGKNILDMFPNVAAFGLIDTIQRVWRTGKSENHPISFYKDERIDGWRDNEVYKLRSGEIVAIYDDVTQRKQAVELLAKKEERFRSMVNSIADAIMVVNPDGNVLLVNPAAEVLFDRSKKELLDKPLGLPLSVDDLDMQTEIEVRCKNNVTRFAEMKAAKTYWDDNEAIMLSLRDITDRKYAEDEKEKMKEQLLQAQKMESIGTLAGGIAHDFNNILSAIIGFTEISIDDLDEESGIYDNLQEVLRAGLRAKDLVSQILTFSRESQTDLKPLKVSLIVSEALKLLYASIPTSIEFHQNISSKAAVKADPTQIHQIVMNLCTNAYHAMRETGGVLMVSLKDIEIEKPLHKGHIIVEPGRWVHLTVSDTGHGISPQILNRIFEPYFTTKEKGDGTGLGLAVVQGVVEKCEGKISAGSAINKGTTFDIFLPIYASDTLPLAQTAVPITTGTGHILVVDDELPIVKMIRQSVESLGYTAEIRTSPIEALEFLKIHHHRFDLVISDMTMPKMNGLQLADQLHQFCPNMPFILCTGYSDQIKKADFSRLGINALAMKPLVKNDLANLIKKAMDDGNESS